MEKRKTKENKKNIIKNPQHDIQQSDWLETHFATQVIDIFQCLIIIKFIPGTRPKWKRNHDHQNKITQCNEKLNKTRKSSYSAWTWALVWMCEEERCIVWYIYTEAVLIYFSCVHTIILRPVTTRAASEPLRRFHSAQRRPLYQGIIFVQSKLCYTALSKQAPAQTVRQL